MSLPDRLPAGIPACQDDTGPSDADEAVRLLVQDPSPALRSLIEAMWGCEQSRGQSVLGHGIAVRRTYLAIVDHLEGRREAESWWRLPAWLPTAWPLIRDRLPDDRIMAEYLVFHDCGKPSCRTVDEAGRAHFPGHAAASERTWLETGGDPLAARLMGMDMDAHLLKAEGLSEFAARPEAPALLLAAIAEVHSNALMFGGTESDSFKMKAKHLDKRGRQALTLAGLLEGAKT